MRKVRPLLARVLGLCVVVATLSIFSVPAHADSINVSVTIAVLECSDGIDNDSDTLIDYPLDLGCESAVDDDETDPPVPPVSSEEGGSGGGSRSYPPRESSAVASFRGVAYPYAWVAGFRNNVFVGMVQADEHGAFVFSSRQFPSGPSFFSFHAFSSSEGLVAAQPFMLDLRANTQADVADIAVMDPSPEDAPIRFFDEIRAPLQASIPLQPPIISTGHIIPPDLSEYQLDIYRNDLFTLRGHTYPNATVTISWRNRDSIVAQDTFKSDASGLFVYERPTTEFRRSVKNPAHILGIPNISLTERHAFTTSVTKDGVTSSSTPEVRVLVYREIIPIRWSSFCTALSYTRFLLPSSYFFMSSPLQASCDAA